MPAKAIGRQVVFLLLGHSFITQHVSCKQGNVLFACQLIYTLVKDRAGWLPPEEECMELDTKFIQQGEVGLGKQTSVKQEDCYP